MISSIKSTSAAPAYQTKTQTDTASALKPLSMDTPAYQLLLNRQKEGSSMPSTIQNVFYNPNVTNTLVGQAMDTEYMINHRRAESEATFQKYLDSTGQTMEEYLTNYQNSIISPESPTTEIKSQEDAYNSILSSFDSFLNGLDALYESSDFTPDDEVGVYDSLQQIAATLNDYNKNYESFDSAPLLERLNKYDPENKNELVNYARELINEAFQGDIVEPDEVRVQAAFNNAFADKIEQYNSEQAEAEANKEKTKESLQSQIQMMQEKIRRMELEMQDLQLGTIDSLGDKNGQLRQLDRNITAAKKQLAALKEQLQNIGSQQQIPQKSSQPNFSGKTIEYVGQDNAAAAESSQTN